MSNQDLEIETNEPIENDDDCELIRMYLENEKRSKCGFSISKYKKTSKYSMIITLENAIAADKSIFLKNKNLSIGNFSCLNLNLPMNDLIVKQEDSYEKSNQMLIFYDINKKCYGHDNEFLKLVVDLLTSDTDDCENKAIKFSKIFENCAYVEYTKEFNGNLLLQKYNSNQNLKNNCKFLPCFKDTNYLVLRINETETIMQTIDFIKAKYQFQSVRPFGVLLLLQFKSLDDMKLFRNENEYNYDIEVVYNLALIDICMNSIRKNVTRGRIQGEATIKTLANPWIEEERVHQVVLTYEFHPYVQLVGSNLVLLNHLKSILAQFNYFDNCNYANDELRITIISMKKQADEMKIFLKNYLNNQIKLDSVNFHFSNSIRNHDDGRIFSDAYLNRLKANHNIYFCETILTRESFEVYGLTADVDGFIEAINRWNETVIDNVQFYKKQILRDHDEWIQLSDMFLALSNCNLIKITNGNRIKIKGKFIETKFLEDFLQDIFNRLQFDTINPTAEQVNRLKENETEIYRQLKQRNIFAALDFNDLVTFYSLNRTDIDRAINYVKQTYQLND